MTKEQHLLVILAEECGELAQVASKAIRFGMLDWEPGQPDTNRRRIEKELADVCAVAQMLGIEPNVDDKARKRARVKKYMDISRGLGKWGARKAGKG